MLALASVAADKISPVGAGTRITWTAQAGGGPGPLQYEFLRYRESTGSWTIVQPYGAADSYSWTPTSADIGAAALQVWVRTVGSTQAFEAWAGTGYFLIEP